MPEEVSPPKPPYLIHKIGEAGLWIMPAPVFNGNLTASLKQCRDLGITHLASLIEQHECSALGLNSLSKECLHTGITLYRLPLADRQPPSVLPPFLHLAAHLVEQLRKGQSVGIHCKSGIGRSGMLAVAILSQVGFQLPEALDLIEQQRGQKAPNTDSQLEWLDENWNDILKTGNT